MAIPIQLENPVEETSPAGSIPNRFPISVIPPPIESIQGDPLAEKREVVIVAVTLFDSLQPTTGPVEADVCRMFRVKLLEPFFLGLPASAEVSHRERGHDVIPECQCPPWQDSSVTEKVRFKDTSTEAVSKAWW
jgi:hypothetical protein